MSGPLSYVVQHPKRCEVRVSARVLKNRSAVPREREMGIFVDAIEGNHDPCVLTDPWLYSYCHASQLRRTQMGPGSMIFFYDHEREAFDTVFSVRDRHDWDRVMPSSPPLPIRIRLPPRAEKDAWDLHFQWPSRGHHEKTRVTFEAAMFSADPYSFLPLRGGQPVGAASLGLSWLEPQINQHKWRRRPIRLAAREAAELYAATSRAADAKVIGHVRLLDPEDLRKVGKEPGEWEAGDCQHCGREASP